MPNYRKATRRAARKYRINPDLFERQIGAESNFNPNAGSPAGAQGIAQFMPATAKGMGVDLNDGRVTDDLEGAARLMANYVKKYGSYEKALRAYNAGPAAIERSRGYRETNDYVAKILRGSNPRGTTPGPSRPGSETTTTTTSTPGVDNSALRKQLLQQYVLQRNHPDALLGLARGLSGAQDVAPTSRTTTAGPTKLTKAPAGARSAVKWAQSTVGEAETSGANSSPRIDQWQARFGMGSQAWCAMWTSLAATKGGMPKAGRTASVAEVRAQAQQGRGGYKGLVDPKKAKPGDLILFGNDHIGMVEENTGQGLVMIAGNDSNKVNRRTVGYGAGDVARPRYKR